MANTGPEHTLKGPYRASRFPHLSITSNRSWDKKGGKTSSLQVVVGIFEWKCTDFCSKKENITHFPMWILPLTAFISWIQHHKITKSHILFIVEVPNVAYFSFKTKSPCPCPQQNQILDPKEPVSQGTLSIVYILAKKLDKKEIIFSWFPLMLKGFKLRTSCFVSKLEPLTVNRVSRCREFHPCCGMFNIPFSSKEILLLLSFSSRFLERPLILKAVWK